MPGYRASCLLEYKFVLVVMIFVVIVLRFTTTGAHNLNPASPLLTTALLVFTSCQVASWRISGDWAWPQQLCHPYTLPNKDLEEIEERKGIELGVVTR